MRPSSEGLSTSNELLLDTSQTHVPFQILLLCVLLHIVTFVMVKVQSVRTYLLSHALNPSIYFIVIPIPRPDRPSL